MPRTARALFGDLALADRAGQMDWRLSWDFDSRPRVQYTGHGALIPFISQPHLSPKLHPAPQNLMAQVSGPPEGCLRADATLS